MAVRIRLARRGKKNYAFFNIVVADSRAPRDGRFIEQLGTYNPNTNPATIELNSERALKWLMDGAQPSETCRRILSYKGVLLRKHLLEGVKKGALTEEQVEERWNAWKEEKDLKISKQRTEVENSRREARKSAIEAEAKVNQARAEELAKRLQEEEDALRKAEEEAAAAKKAEEDAKKAEEEAKEAEEAPVEETPAEEAPAKEEKKAEEAKEEEA